MPVGPVAQTVLCSTNFYAVNSATAQPELSWELLRWLTVEPDFGRFLMQTLLYPPVRLDQWEQWRAIVTTVAPSLRSKDLGVFVHQAAADRLWAGTVFPYPDAAVYPILADASQQLLQGKVSVARGFASIARQIDALATL